MKKKIVINIILIFCICISDSLFIMNASAAYDTLVEINETNFPDPNFKAYISENFDSDNDGYLSDNELSSIVNINCWNLGISSLKGIEYFTELEILDCSRNALTNLDISKNTKLTELYCYNNLLHSLDLAKNIKLVKLYCAHNMLSSLDLRSNTRLMYLYCNDNFIFSLDLNSNAVLCRLNCSSNRIDTININKNPYLLQAYNSPTYSEKYNDHISLYVLSEDKHIVSALTIDENTVVIHDDDNKPTGDSMVSALITITMAGMIAVLTHKKR